MKYPPVPLVHLRIDTDIGFRLRHTTGSELMTRSRLGWPVGRCLVPLQKTRRPTRTEDIQVGPTRPRETTTEVMTGTRLKSTTPMGLTRVETPNDRRSTTRRWPRPSGTGVVDGVPRLLLGTIVQRVTKSVFLTTSVVPLENNTPLLDASPLPVLWANRSLSNGWWTTLPVGRGTGREKNRSPGEERHSILGTPGTVTILYEVVVLLYTMSGLLKEEKVIIGTAP